MEIGRLSGRRDGERRWCDLDLRDDLGCGCGGAMVVGGVARGGIVVVVALVEVVMSWKVLGSQVVWSP
jgi:hypothetical protein